MRSSVSRFLSPWIAATIVFTLFALAGEARKPHVRQELANLQAQFGWSLVYLGRDELHVYLFDKQDWYYTKKLSPWFNPSNAVLSPRGEYVADEEEDLLAVRLLDGQVVRRFEAIHTPWGVCWSHDGKRLAFRSRIGPPAGKETPYRIHVAEIESGKIEMTTADGYVGNQCWSPDSKRFIYSTKEGQIVIFDTEVRNSVELVSGKAATWSPDGKWIAYAADEERFFLLDPATKQRKLLIKDKKVYGEMMWSPDSRFVAYLTWLGFWEDMRRGLTAWPLEAVRVKVRRVDDGATDWVMTLSGKGHGAVQWVRNPELLKSAEPPKKAWSD